jgi:hypothetical protein
VDKVKINTNVYKILLRFFLTIFIYHDIQTEEKFIQEEDNEELQDIDQLETMFRKNNNNGLENLCTLLAKQTVQKIVGSNSINNLTSISNTINEIQTLVTPLEENLTILITDLQAVANSLTNSIDTLTVLIAILNNLPIVKQLGLINTTVASPALTTTLIVSNFNVDDYNNDIAAALLLVTVALNTPSKINTSSAKNILGIAINTFNNVSINHDTKAVLSMYSFAEIKTELARLNADLGYLYILQDL